jgi:transposase
MNNTAIIEQILNFGKDWRVSRVEADHLNQTVHIHLEYVNPLGIDPQTGAPCPLYDHRKERVWQHLPIMQYSTYLHCRVPRVRSSEGRIRTIRVPWADEGERHTYLFESFIIDLLQACRNQTKVAELMQTSFDKVNRIMTLATKRGLTRRAIADGEVRQLSLDEKSFLKGHRYVSVPVDPVGKRVLDMAEGRTIEATKALLSNTLTQSQLASVKAVSLDMWEAYIKAVASLMPEAEIVHDKFHIVKYLNGTLDDTRKQEVRSQSTLKDSKYALLKHQDNLTELQRAKFEEVMEAGLNTSYAWCLCEDFRAVLEADCLSEGLAFYDMWEERVKESMIKPMIRLAKTFRNHLEGILNVIKYRITNALSERFNGKIQELKTIGRGYRVFENFRHAILFYNGNLDLHPHSQ